MMDPILTPLIVSGLVALGVSGATATFLAPILGGIIIAAGSILLAVLLAPKPPKPDDGKLAITQSIPPRIFVYGTARVAGAVVFQEVAYGSLFYVAALTAHPISGRSHIYLNDDEVTVVGTVVQPRADGGYGEGKVLLLFRNGLVPETNYSEVTATFPTLWDDDHRGDGCASLYMKCHDTNIKDFGKRFPFGKPAPSAAVKGYVIYDPRITGQDPDDSSTWEWSTNSALCILHFLCFSEFGPQRNYARTIAPVLDLWIAEADICDEAVALNEGGTIPRYELNGWGTGENDPKSILAQMLATCDGHLVDRGDGTAVLKVGKFRESSITITDDDIIGFYIQTDVPDEEIVNRLNVSYTSPDHKFSEVDADPLDDLEDQAARGAIRSQKFELVWAQSNALARRLAKREMYRLRRKLRGTLDIRLGALNLCYERWIYIDSLMVPRLNGVWIETRTARINLMNGGFVRIEFIGSGTDVDDYDAPVDEGDAPPVPAEPESLAPGAPTDINVTVEQFQISASQFGVRLAVSFDEPSTDAQLDYAVRYRIITSTGVGGAFITQTFNNPPDAIGGRITLLTNIVDGDESLEVQTQAIGGGHGPSAWSSSTYVDTTVDDAAPGVVTSLTDLSSTDHVHLAWRAPNSPNFHSAKVYRNTIDDVGSSSLAGEVFGAASALQSLDDDGLFSGTYYYWVRSANGSEIVGVAVATGAIIVP